MKKLAARDFEDLLQVSIASTLLAWTDDALQCAMPVFDGLLPKPHGKIVLDLLFVLSQWHALAKLRMHTEYTIDLLETTTTTLGRCVNIFKAKTCAFYITRELKGETAARGRRALAKARNSGSCQVTDGLGSKVKEYNNNTYKFHALGDYAASIRRVGTMDGVSTQNVQLSFIHSFTGRPFAFY